MRRAAPWVALVLALAFPLAMQAEHQTYYLSFASRIFVYALAATSLNLILGYGGMISFCPAALLGPRAYLSPLLLSEGAANARGSWAAARARSAPPPLPLSAVLPRAA